MKTVVSNTSPLRYLIFIGAEFILHDLFKNIHIPKAVYLELTHSKTPEIVRKYMSSLPDWIQITEIEEVKEGWLESLSHLDRGEREAIILAKLKHANLFLVDEKKGREAARNVGLEITGTLNILHTAGIQKKIDLRAAIDKLLQTNIRLAPSLVKKILKSS